VFDDVPVVAAVFAVVAAIIHGYIFVMESILWTTPRVRATFGVASAQEAQTTRALAFNQGWYNLFLAIGTVTGIVLATSGDVAVRGAGVGILLLATGSMVAAALVLVVSNPRMARAAAVQGLAPLVAVVLTLTMR
jgi:putative membrane protein